jgi:hypothetical protein
MTLQAVAGHLAHLIVAGIWGGMLFFAGVVAPTVFKAMDSSRAGAFLREFFPVYYLVLGVAGIVATAAAALATQFTATDAIVLTAVFVGFLAARIQLIPRINAARDLVLAGDAAGPARFRRWHGVSVGVNVLQLLALTVVLVRIY